MEHTESVLPRRNTTLVIEHYDLLSGATTVTQSTANLATTIVSANRFSHGFVQFTNAAAVGGGGFQGTPQAVFRRAVHLLAAGRLLAAAGGRRSYSAGRN